jgi:hypothetical protein
LKEERRRLVGERCALPGRRDTLMNRPGRLHPHNPRPQTPHPKPQTQNLKPQIPNPKPFTPTPKVKSELLIILGATPPKDSHGTLDKVTLYRLCPCPPLRGCIPQMHSGHPTRGCTPGPLVDRCCSKSADPKRSTLKLKPQTLIPEP